MGRGKKRWNKSQGQQRKPREYKEITYTNEAFEEYYKSQRVVPEEDWETFLETLKAPLPVTFRFTGSRAYAKSLAETCRHKYFPSLEHIEVDGVTFDPPSPLPWYPDLLAYQYDVARKQLRKSEAFRQFHAFLTSETEIGNISRQEAVSMIPPLLLDVQPHHKVLDMCAAPGSKTAQLIERVHAGDDDAAGNGATSDGLVIANDADGQRAYMLVHQTRRLQSPCLLVTNHEAQYFPTVYDPTTDEPIKFDRVLADVPCSGDGTLRKNAAIWNDWNANQAAGLHILQLRILMRALTLTKAGGKVVYSTCSLNPIENEAVVAAALGRCGGAVELVDASENLPALKRASGLHTWKVPSIKTKGHLYETMNDVEDKDKIRITRSFFPPSDPAEMHLERCLRIYPHLQNTGGFFVAVLHKTAEINLEGKTQFGEEPEDFPVRKNARGPRQDKKEGDSANSEASAEVAAVEPRAVATPVSDAKSDDQIAEPERKRKLEADEAEDNEVRKQPRVEDNGDALPTETEKENASKGKAKSGERHSNQRHYEDPFIFLNKEDAEVQTIIDAYGLPDSFPVDQLVVRSEKAEHQAIYYCSAAVKRLLLANNAHRLKVVNTGVRLLSRVHDADARKECTHRFNSDGVAMVAPLLTKRVARIGRATLERLLTSENAVFVRDLVQPDAQLLEALPTGGAVVSHDHDGVDLALSLWRGAVSVRLLINDRERVSLINRLDLEVPAHLIKTSKKRGEDAAAEPAEQSSEQITEVAAEDAA